LLHRRYFEQCLKLLAHSSFFGDRCLPAVAQQHGCSGEVLRHSPEERRGITVGVGIDVRTLIGALVVVACAPSSLRRRGGGSRLFSSRTVLLVLAVSLTGLLLHRDQLRDRQRCGLPVAELWVLPQLVV
jgi:hypothetical protein